jgi:kumamolisin
MAEVRMARLGGGDGLRRRGGSSRRTASICALLCLATLAVSGAATTAVASTTVSAATATAPTAATTAASHGLTLAPISPGRDLGRTRATSVSFLVSLRADDRPTCLSHWAVQRGLSVQWDRGQPWVTVSGAVPSVERSFGVRIDDFRAATGRVVTAATTRAVAPPQVCGEVAGVGAIRSFTAPTMEDVPGQGLSATDLLRTYDVAPLRAQGMDGQGQTVVFFESDGFAKSDLTKFARAEHLPPFNVQVVGKNPGNGEETPLDLETVHEIAPDAKLVFVNITSGHLAQVGSVGAVLAADFATANRRWKGADISVSLGYCESGGDFDQSDLESVNAAVATVENNGGTVFGSSGDAGGLDCTPANDGGQPPKSSFAGVVDPAALPNVTGVGGTALDTTSNGTWTGETTWSEPLLSQGSGGGASEGFARPSWQTGTGTGGQLDQGNGRQVPDVAADADPSTGTLVIVGGEVQPGGGTSLATPMWAAFTSLIDQYLRAHGKPPVGFFNPTLYGLANGAPALAPFHDVTEGGNDFFPATPGYDMVTGLGSPDVWHLAQDVAAISTRPKAGR